MGQNKNKNFELFRDWLEMTKPKSASEIVSNIRKLETLLQNKVTYVTGEKLDELHTFYGKLVPLSRQTISGRKNELFKIKQALGGWYDVLTKKSIQKQNGLDKCKKKQLDNFKTAYLDYVRFLGDVFGMFTLRELENERFIERERSKEGTILSGILTGDMFRKGLFKIFKKFKLFASLDGKMITMSLDTFMEILEEYAATRGADLRKELYGVTSCIVTTDIQISPNWESWESVFVSNVSAEINGEPIDLANADEVIFDRYSDELEITDSCGNVQSYQVERAYIDRKSPHSKLSLRMLSRLPIREQRPIIEKLINSCKEISSETIKYREIIPLDLDLEQRLQLLPTAFENINLNRVFYSAVEALAALAEYARGFRVELVAE